MPKTTSIPIKTQNPQQPPVLPITNPTDRGYATGWLSVDNLEQLQSDVRAALVVMQHDMQTDALTSAERKRLQGLGTSRYGFTDKVKDFAVTNPEFAPSFFSAATLDVRIREAEILRDISADLEQMLRINNDVLLEVSDDAYNMALSYYNTVHEAAKRKRPGAQAIFNTLKSFFRRRTRKKAEPTTMEVERDVRALLHGTKDGKIVVENEKPHMTGGKHVVIDETQKAHAAWKETEQGEISD